MLINSLVKMVLYQAQVKFVKKTNNLHVVQDNHTW